MLPVCKIENEAQVPYLTAAEIATPCLFLDHPCDLERPPYQSIRVLLYFTMDYFYFVYFDYISHNIRITERGSRPNGSTYCTVPYRYPFRCRKCVFSRIRTRTGIRYYRTVVGSLSSNQSPIYKFPKTHTRRQSHAESTHNTVRAITDHYQPHNTKYKILNAQSLSYYNTV